MAAPDFIDALCTFLDAFKPAEVEAEAEADDEPFDWTPYHEAWRNEHEVWWPLQYQCWVCEQYEVSNRGRFRRQVQKGVYKMLTLQNGVGGYQYVYFYFHGKKLRRGIHRLMAYTFLGNPDPCDEKCIVNHIDGWPRNNNIGNLEWVSHSGNALHRWKLERERVRLLTT